MCVVCSVCMCVVFYVCSVVRSIFINSLYPPTCHFAYRIGKEIIFVLKTEIL